MKKKNSLSARIRYRFDALMAKGNISMVKMLVLATLAAVILIALILWLLTEPEDRSLAGSFWDVLATAVNAWMPYSDEGSAGQILLTALAAVTGLLFTSILIGIIASAIEEKVTGLKDGNSVVLERDHIVVLGFVPGEYTLLRQLIAGARGKKLCIVVAGDLPRSETEEAIRENVEIPKNVKIICRRAEAGDVAALTVCSVQDCKTVVVNQPDDAATVKSMLAAHRLLSSHGQTQVKVISNVADEAFLLLHDTAAARNLICVCVTDVIARVIAHSCAETGIAAAYVDLFDLDGGSLRLLRLPACVGKTFGQTARTLDGAVVVGIESGERILLNPPTETVVGENDRLICWAETGRQISFAEDTYAALTAQLPAPVPAASAERTVVLGGSPMLKTLLRELPEQENYVTVAGVSEDRRAALAAFTDRRQDLTLAFFDGDPESEADLRRLLTGVQHAVILSDADAEESDVLNIMRYLRISDLKKRENLSFSVTLELKSEKNLQLIGEDDDADFIVAPHIVSMFLAQLADCPEIVSVFKELLSNRGSEIHLKPASLAGAEGTVTCAALRARLLARKMILLGYIAAGETVLNPPLAQTVSAETLDRLIVISED